MEYEILKNLHGFQLPRVESLEEPEPEWSAQDKLDRRGIQQKMAMADIWRVLDKRCNAQRTSRSYCVMVRPSVQQGQSGNFRVELKTRRALMFKRLVVLRGTVHMSA